MIRILEGFVKVLSWLRFAISPILAGAIIGLLIYLSRKDIMGIGLGLAVVILGLILGILLANKSTKKQDAKF